MPGVDRHRHRPIPFRPAEGDRSWLLDHARQTGQPVNAILRAALAAYREREKESAAQP